MKLRDYQQKAYDSILRDLNESPSTLIVCATGTGKTVIFSHVAKHFQEKGRVMILAHREELIYQARDKIAAVTGVVPGVEMAESWADKMTLMNGGGEDRIVVSTIQTQSAGWNGKGRMNRFNPQDFSLLIVDECHHGVAESYKKVTSYYQQNPNLRVLGVTATPDRKDELALGQVFERVSAVMEINDGIVEGWLVPIMQSFVHVEGLDFSNVRTTQGDLNPGDLAAVMEYEANLHGIADSTIEIAKGRKTLVFAASVAHAERLSEIFNRHKSGCSNWLCGKTDDVDRKRMLREFTSGDLQFMVNCGVLLEGYDEPSIEVVAMGRPTKSRSLYAQAVGRGTRPLSGVTDGIETAAARVAAIQASSKKYLEVLDFTGNAGRHKLICTADILGGEYAEDLVNAVAEAGKKEDGPVDMRKMMEEAEKARLKKEAEERMRAEAASRSTLLAKAKYTKRIINAFDILDLAPPSERGWDKGHPASPKQAEALRGHGIENAASLSRVQAQAMLDQIYERKEKGICSLRQAQCLKRAGYPTDISAGEAGRIMQELVENGWQRKYDAPRELVGAEQGEI